MCFYICICIQCSKESSEQCNTCLKVCIFRGKNAFFLQFNIIFSTLITVVPTNIGIQIHLWELLPYINLRLLSSTFMTHVATISHVTNRVNETAEQHLVPNWIDFLIVLQQVVVKLQNYLMCKSKATFWLGWGQKKTKQKTIVWWTHKFMLPENCRMISLCQNIMLNINAKNDSEWKIIIWIFGPSPTISQIALKKWINVAFVWLYIIKWQEIL